MTLKKLLIGAFATFLFIFVPQNVFACSCAEKPTVLENFESSEIVVTAGIASLEKKGTFKEAEADRPTIISHMHQ